MSDAPIPADIQKTALAVALAICTSSESMETIIYRALMAERERCAATIAEQAKVIERLREALRIVSGMLDASIKRTTVREDQEPVTLILNGARLGTFTYKSALDMADAALEEK